MTSRVSPLETRLHSVLDQIAFPGDITLFARYLTDHVDYRALTGPEQKLKFLAQDILRIVARSDDDLKLDFRAELAKGQISYLALLHKQLARTEKFNSVELQEYLRRGIDELQQAVSSNNSPTSIAGVPADWTEADFFARFRSLAEDFSAALDGWAEMRSVAASLSEVLISSKDMLPR